MTHFEDDPSVGDELPITESQVSRRLVIASGLAGIAGGAAWWLTGRQPDNYKPQRAGVPTPLVEPSLSVSPTATPTREIVIAASGIH